MKTMICLILDRSGSMTGRETDVVGGVNKFIEEQKQLPDPASLAIVRFDDQAIERFREMKPLAQVEPLQPKEFIPRGNTPLLDAVGSTIAKLDEDWKTEKPDRCILMIVTDGQENASKEYTKGKVKSMIEARQNSNLWAIIYLGANVDAFAEAGAMGINLANTAGYRNTSAGTASSYATASGSVRHMRVSGSTVAHNLGGNIDEDGSLHKPGTAAPVQPSQGNVQSNWAPPVSNTAAGNSGAWTPPA